MQFATPGVFIQEVTGPGVIAGVGTSTAAFLGPTRRGPLNQPRRITSLDEFIEVYGVTRDNRPWPYLFVEGRPFYLGFGVQGFFQNGGSQAFVVRIGTARQSSLPIKNRDGESVFVTRAREDGATGDQILVETQVSGVQAAVTAQTSNTAFVGNTVTVDQPGIFRVGDFVTANNKRAQIIQIQGDNLILDGPLGASGGDTLRIDDIPTTQDAFRVESTAGLLSRATALIDDGPHRERVIIDKVDPATGFVTLAAAPPRNETYNLDSTSSTARLISVRRVAVGTAVVTGDDAAVPSVTVDEPAPFRPGDVITSDGTARAQITQIQGNNLILNQELAGLGAGVRIADIPPAQLTFRLADTVGLVPGSVVQMRGDDADNPGTEADEYAVVQAIDGAGFVTLETTPVRSHTFNLDVTAGSEPILIPQEFRLIVTPPQPASGTLPAERFENLSLNPFHPRFLFNPGVIESDWVTVEEPPEPPTAAGYPNRLVAIGGPDPLAGGQDDQPTALTAADYQTGLDALRDVDDVNLVVIPDASSHPERRQIQNAMINHCLDLQDRFAVLDSVRGAPLSGPGSVEEHRQQVTSARGFAALYYPWLRVRDPQATGPLPRTLLVPPSGHVTGVFARTDQEVGVHKAPANTDVRGVLGLEIQLSDRQQGPLNLAGVNALRIFPGTAQVVVWGARTTVDPIITDWLYVNVRRLLLFIEESIEEGIRWAVFEPNNLALWQKLKRTLNDFLTRVWRDGALFGASAEEAFRVRIDEALNPPSVRALGRLFIEISVAPVRPAEFIVVRIGLFDGGAEVAEN